MELDEYVRLWNTHLIRTQPKRPYLKTGKPHVLFHWPTVKQKGVQSGYDVPPELLDPIEQYAGDFGLSSMSMRVEAFDFILTTIDPNEILPPETFAWCADQLRQLGFTANINGRVCTETGDRVYRQAYLQLRDSARHHWSQGNTDPELIETLPPRPGYVPSQETQDLFRRAGQQIDDVAYCYFFVLGRGCVNPVLYSLLLVFLPLSLAPSPGFAGV